MNKDLPRTYGFDDPLLAPKSVATGTRKWLGIVFALLFLTAVWLALDQKLLFGDAWISNTYDNPDWRTNEGNLHTFGAWDLETHIWKTEYIMEHFPNHQWNPYWYLGMPLIKYYQSGFYLLQAILITLIGASAARSALLLVVFGHLAATIMTFMLCYRVSKKAWVSALCASFVLTNTFLSLRSYGWEPITVVFLFLFPLGMYVFLKEPLRPLRFWLIVILAIAYLSHPLLWFSLCMTFGLYLASIAVRQEATVKAKTTHYLLHFIVLVFLSLLVGAVQFIPQVTYQQVTSGAHMGVTYLPFYQVASNIIAPQEFFFDMGNLKGPGPIIMVAFLLLAAFAFLQYRRKKELFVRKLHQHELITGLALILVTMVAFYYFESYNIFPMNVLRSIQYHRIIPEFVIVAAVLVAALSTILYTHKQKVLYHSMLIAFVCISGLLLYSVQAHWVTSESISDSPEFITKDFPGRISFPYTDQSLAVRNSFTRIPQTYGYYEQGITNPYADELFSVSSGYHNANLTLTYLRAAMVSRLYVNMLEGERDAIVRQRFDGVLPFVHEENARYGYFAVPLTNPSFAQAVNGPAAAEVQALEPGCRIMFSEHYCGSVREEFVSTDTSESRYLAAYNTLLDTPSPANADMIMDDADHYRIPVEDATAETAVVVKMTFDRDFSASIHGEDVPITTIGPYFMLLTPQRAGSYTIELEYGTDPLFLIGAVVSVVTIMLLAGYFISRRRKNHGNPPIDGSATFYLSLKRGDMT